MKTYQNQPTDADDDEVSDYPPGGAKPQTARPKGPGFNKPKPPQRTNLGAEATRFNELQTLLASIRNARRRVVR